MKLIYRFLYFFGGFGIGIIILFFFLSGKKTSCDYGIQARTLKNIRLKDRSFTDESLSFFTNNKIDTSEVTNILKTGKVLFSESEARLKPCGFYVIQGKVSEKTMKIEVSNCEDSATVMDAYFEE